MHSNKPGTAISRHVIITLSFDGLAATVACHTHSRAIFDRFAEQIRWPDG